MLRLFCFIILVIYGTFTSLSQDFLINEVQSSNQFTISDNFDEFDDWVEIRCDAEDGGSLAGWILENGVGEQYVFPDNPDVVLEENGVLLLWA
ncbi:MAG: hypothetical protein HKN32_06015, partial [Flavobacteriales bacterium]|nr:hypothetical protein [Flavobacteriales bacterium]